MIFHRVGDMLVPLLPLFVLPVADALHYSRHFVSFGVSPPKYECIS